MVADVTPQNVTKLVGPGPMRGAAQACLATRRRGSRFRGIDAITGELKWQVPLGKFGTVPGAVNLGGPLTTSTGLTFIGATFDGYFRAFVGSEVTGERPVHTHDLHLPGPAVCRDCGGRA